MPKKKQYDKLETHLDGVRLRVIKGVEELDIPPKTIERVVEEGRILVEVRDDITDLKEKEKVQEVKIIRSVERYPGWVGITTPDFPVLVYERVAPFRDRKNLKQALGPHYQSVVRESLILEIPLGLVNGAVIASEKIIEAVTKALIKIGVSEDNAQKVIGVQVKLDVDQEKLKQGATEGKWELPPVEKEPTWVVKTK